MRYLAGLLLAGAAITASACNDSSFRIDPLLTTDTVEVFAPSAQAGEVPTALDVTVSFGGINGARFPERAADAGEWDFALRVRDGGLALVPASALGIESRAALTRAVAGKTFEGVVEAPGAASFSDSTHVVLRVGEVYVARSRSTRSTFGACEQFSKLQPLEVDVPAGRAVLRLTTNERCGDPRLALEG